MHVVINALSLRPGGGLQVISALLRSFSDQYRYTVLSADPAAQDFLAGVLAGKAHITVTDPVGSPSNIRLFAWQMTRLAGCLKGLGADLMVGVNHHFPAGGIPQIIYHLNVLRFERPRAGLTQSGEVADRLRDWRARRALTHADANVFESRYLMDLAARRAPIRNGSVVYIGRGPARAGAPDTPPVQQTPPSAPPSATLLSLTSDQPHKDNPVLLDMLDALRTARPDVPWHLAIAGGAQEGAFAALKAEIAQRGQADAVTFLGFLDHETLAGHGAQALALVSTSRIESFCMVALEAMSWGCPAIVADSTAMPESVGDAGLLAPPGDGAGFAEQALRLYDDPALRADLIARGYAHITPLTWTSAADAFETLFSTLIPDTQGSRTMTPHEAVAQVRRKFPFSNYFGGNLAPWLTVGETVQQYLKPGDRLFDLGSGPCDKTAVAQLLGIQCAAMDDLNDDWHLRGDNREKIKAFARDMGIDFTTERATLEPGAYDMVMMNDVLEHLTDSPRDVMNMLVEGLKDGGLVFITVPNLANIRKRIDILRGRTNLPNFDLYYWWPGPWRGPRREYVRGDLTSMCAHLGLEIVELKTVHHMLQNLPGPARPVYKAVTALFPGWRDTWHLVARKPAGWQPRTQLGDAEFAKIYGRSANESLYD